MDDRFSEESERRQNGTRNGKTPVVPRGGSVNNRYGRVLRRLELATKVDPSRDEWKASEITRPTVTVPTITLCW